MIKYIKRAVYLFTTLILTVTALDPDQTGNETNKYGWPLNIFNGFSRSFQEFGSNHFHAGIDLRTFQRTGYPVFAIADGEIYRIIMAKRGSGRGLYLRHRDGNISIYYHLDKFAPNLETISLQVQKAKNTKYFGDYILAAPLPVNEGDLIAYSGETGAGFPHLHLEIRDKNYDAVNPFPLLEFPGKDANSPVLRGIILRNRGDSLINGRIGENFIKLHSQKNHTYAIKNPLLVTGPCDIVLNTYDISDTGKLTAPHEVTAYIDDQRYFRLVFDRFKNDDNNQLGFVYDMYHSSTTSFFFNLFSQEGFALENDKNNLDHILENIPPGEHLLKIEVKDNQGNLSTGLVPFFKIQNPVIEVSNIVKQANGVSLDIDNLQAGAADRILIKMLDGDKKNLYSGVLQQRSSSEILPLLLKGVPGNMTYLDFNFIKDNILYFTRRFPLNADHLSKISSVSFNTFINRDDIFIQLVNPAPAPGNIELKAIQGQEAMNIAPQCRSDNLFFRFKPMNLENSLMLRFRFLAGEQLQAEIQEKIEIIHLQKGSEQHFRYGDFRAHFFPRSVYEAKVLLVEEKNFPADYPVLSNQVSLSPYNFPFLDTVFYGFMKDVPDPEQVGIFKYSPKYKQWFYVFTTYDHALRLFETRVISSGTFALMRDTFPPRIYFSRPNTNRLVYVKKLIVIVKDSGKGVNDDSLKVYINGNYIDCEYDPDRRYARIEELSALKKGENKIYISVKDWAGNTSTKTYRFYLN